MLSGSKGRRLEVRKFTLATSSLMVNHGHHHTTPKKGFEGVRHFNNRNTTTQHPRNSLSAPSPTTLPSDGIEAVQRSRVRTREKNNHPIDNPVPKKQTFRAGQLSLPAWRTSDRLACTRKGGTHLGSSTFISDRKKTTSLFSHTPTLPNS
jgi:hypothetical protein